MQNTKVDPTFNLLHFVWGFGEIGEMEKDTSIIYDALFKSYLFWEKGYLQLFKKFIKKWLVIKKFPENVN